MVRWTETEVELRNRRLNAPPPASVIEFTANVRIVSEMNQRCHWSVRKRRFDAQRTAVWAAWPRKRGKAITLPMPVTVTLTRIGPRKLDSDNLAGGAKACRDEIARILGVDDGSDAITFIYKQEKGSPKLYALQIRIEAA